MTTSCKRARAIAAAIAAIDALLRHAHASRPDHLLVAGGDPLDRDSVERWGGRAYEEDRDIVHCGFGRDPAAGPAAGPAAVVVMLPRIDAVHVRTRCELWADEHGPLLIVSRDAQSHFAFDGRALEHRRGLPSPLDAGRARAAPAGRPSIALILAPRADIPNFSVY